MKKYKFTKKYDFWKPDHYENFSYIKDFFSLNKYPKDPYPDFQLGFLEIGVFEGRTSVWLMDNVLNQGAPDVEHGILHCIDKELNKNAKYNFRQHQEHMIFYLGSSARILINLIYHVLKLDFIYVDGDHNACGLLQDLILSWKMLRIGGIMLIDDYEMETLDPWFYVSHKEFADNPRLRFTHPRIAIDAFLNIYRGQYEIVINNYQIGLKKVAELG
jgi:hypothetical protein